MSFLRRVACVVASGLIVQSCAIPPYRSASSFPREQVFARIKCELYRAVISTRISQETDNYRKTHTQFPIEKYLAVLIFGEKSSQGSGALLGGSVSNTSENRKFEGGSGSFSGFGVGGSNSQYNNASRIIFFKDIVADSQLPKLKGKPDQSFYRTCNNSKVSNLPIGSDLGIAKKLADTLNELSTSPGFVKEEEYNFDFTVTVSAGGTISFVEPVHSISLGAGIDRAYNETLNLTIQLPAS